MSYSKIPIYRSMLLYFLEYGLASLYKWSHHDQMRPMLFTFCCHNDRIIMCVIISNACIHAINTTAANVRYCILLIHAARCLAHFGVDMIASRINMHIKFVLIWPAVYEPQHVCLS